MELKIRIKEVKEEWKPVCTGMRCIIHITENCLWSIVNRDDVETAYKDSGYVINTIRYKDDTHCEGLFRTETIRDATPEEIIAWHCLSIWGSCFKTKCFGVTSRIRDEKCPKNDGTKNPCPARDEWVKAKELLKDKEVILEVI